MSIFLIGSSERRLMEFLVKPIFFRRVMRSIKPHLCSLCGTTISTGSSYFLSLDPDQKTGYHLKYCEECFNQRLERPASSVIEKRLDR